MNCTTFWEKILGRTLDPFASNLRIFRKNWADLETAHPEKTLHLGGDHPMTWIRGWLVTLVAVFVP